MIKNKLGLLIGLTISVIGIILKFTNTIGADTLLALGLIDIIVISSINLTYYENKKVKEFLVYFSIILISSIIFTLIQHRAFIEIFVGALIIGIISLLISYLVYKLRENKQTVVNM